MSRAPPGTSPTTEGYCRVSDSKHQDTDKGGQPGAASPEVVDHPVVPGPAVEGGVQHPAQLPRRTAPVSARARIRESVAARLPQGSRRRAVAKASLVGYRGLVDVGREARRNLRAAGVVPTHAPAYHSWRAAHRATRVELAAQREAFEAARRPLSVLVAVRVGDSTPWSAVKDSVDSAMGQTWGATEVCVCGPLGPGAPAGTGGARPYTDPDVGEAVRAAVEGSRADLVVVLEAGDVLEPDAFYQVATACGQDPLACVVHWDDDVRGTMGAQDPRFRPTFSPEMLLTSNYLGRSVAVRRRAVLAAGGLDPAAGRLGVWDLLLRLDLDRERVLRIPRVMMSVPAREDDVTPLTVDIVRRTLERRGLEAVAEPGAHAVRIRWTPVAPPTVSVVIPTRHNRAMLERCLPSLATTDHPGMDVTVIDNGGRTDEREQWYADTAARLGLDLRVMWWEETPFNYSRVNNVAAAATGGEVLLFLNDDTEVLDPSWLSDLAGWAVRPEIGCAGIQLIGADGRLQHSGVVVGMGGFADNLLEGTATDAITPMGPADWYRDTLAVTGACLAITREQFNRWGGFDEKFVLCGSDVVLGLDAHLDGLRNVCVPFARLRHLESVTRGTSVPSGDFFASYWRYNAFLFGGDPYFSPNLSLGSRHLQLRGPGEPTPQERVAPAIGRNLTVFRQRNDEAESRMLADQCRVDETDVRRVRELHAANAAAFDVRTVNWYIPDIDSPFYGGINTALRMADYLAREHGVENRFVVWGTPPDSFVRSAIAAAFPSLADAPIYFYDGSITEESLAGVPDSDVSIATLWVTAYAVAKAPRTRRKVYLVQDFEPMFYPASTLFALTEETYRLGLYGLCNTANLERIYREDYDGTGFAFTPAVSDQVFHARGRVPRRPEDPVTVFVYARPGHWRNCWELASLALEELKDRMGDGVRIITAGSWAEGAARPGVLKHLGLLDYRATGDLYRRCDVGLALTVSKHPSYLPLELMACGVPVVAFDNPWGHWILKDGHNSLLAQRTVPSLTDKLHRLCTDEELRRTASANALADIAASHADWSTAFSGIHAYLSDPERV